MQHGISSEIRRVSTLLCVCFALGLLFQSFIAPFVIGFIGYIGWHFRQLLRLAKWLEHRERKSTPESVGLWGAVFDSLNRQQRYEHREKRRLKAVVTRIESTMAALNEAVILLDQHNNMSWWNRAAAQLLAFKDSDRGNAVANFIRAPVFVDYLSSGDYETPLSMPSPHNMERQLQCQITRFGQGEALLMIRDITQVHKLEEMRKDFVANISHELRTPLTVIHGYLETLSDVEDMNQRWAKPLIQMQEQTARMKDLVNDLSTLSKLETGAIESIQNAVYLYPLLRNICDGGAMLSGEKKHDIILTCSDNIQIIGNEKELYSAFSNLLFNAIKYSPANTAIVINAAIDNTDRLTVSVQDNGIGIDVQHIPRLTERFYRVDASRAIATGGTGLGLAIVKHVLLRHDGELRIESKPGDGSTFSCLFPSHRTKNI